MKFAFLITLIFLSSPSNSEVCSNYHDPYSFNEISELEVVSQWAISVHNYLIDKAFPDMSKHCRLEMQAGSLYADSIEFQMGAYAHMHAMREKGQTAEEAKKLMIDFVAEKYKNVRQLEKEYNESNKLKINKRIKACFFRGMALHPIMDSTSPSHKGFQVWTPLDLDNIIKHGDAKEAMEEKLGFAFGIPHSHEDMNAIKNDPISEKTTILLMQTTDEYYMSLD